MSTLNLNYLNNISVILCNILKSHMWSFECFRNLYDVKFNLPVETSHQVSIMLQPDNRRSTWTGRAKLPNETTTKRKPF